MNLRSRILVGLCFAVALAFPAIADITYTQGSGTTIFDFTCFTTKHCSAHTPIKSDGTEIFTSSNPGQVNVGSGGIASGAVASGAVAAGALAAGAGVDGWDLTQGAKADTVCATDTGTCSIAALMKKVAANLTTLNTTAGASVAAGSAVIGKVGIDQTTSGVTNGVMNAAGHYETVAASQTAQAMGATGATGDYLSHCVIYPATTSPGVVTVFDNTNAAGTNVIAFPGGASSVSNLVPIAIPVGAISTGGAWKVTTGANVSVACFGKFT